MGFLHTRRADPAPWCSPVLLVGRGFVSPSDTMRDGGLEPFAPFPRTLFGGLPIVLVTRTESCTNPVLTGTIKYDRLSEEGRDLYTRFPKDRKAVAHRSFPRAPQGGVNKRSPGGPNRPFLQVRSRLRWYTIGIPQTATARDLPGAARRHNGTLLENGARHGGVRQSNGPSG